MLNVQGGSGAFGRFGPFLRQLGIRYDALANALVKGNKQCALSRGTKVIRS